MLAFLSLLFGAEFFLGVNVLVSYYAKDDESN